VLKIPDWHCH